MKKNSFFVSSHKLKKIQIKELSWPKQNEAYWIKEINKSKELNKRNKPGEKAWYRNDNSTDADKYGAVSAMVVTSQGKVYIHNKHVVIPVTTDEKQEAIEDYLQTYWQKLLQER